MAASTDGPWQRLAPTALGLGTAALAVPYGPPGGDRPPPRARAARATITAALEHGVRVIDTAPAYGDAEALVGQATAGRDCVIATKLAIPAAGWAALDDAQLRAAVRASVDASRRALGRERLDVLQIHNATPELLARGALLDELRARRDAEQVVALGGTVYGEAAALAAIAAGLDVVQVAFSALDRRPAARVLPAAAAAGAGVVARSTLLRGVLTPAAATLATDRPAFAPLAEAADAFRRAAGATWARLPGAAVAYAAATAGIDTVLLGPASVAELDALVAAASDPVALEPGWQRDLPAELLDPSRWADR